MNCSKCSANIPPNGAFCPQCGTPVAGAVPVIPPHPVRQPPMNTANPPVLTPPPPVYTERELRRRKRREKRRRARGFWYHPVTNIVCLVLMVAGWFFIPKNILTYAESIDMGARWNTPDKIMNLLSGREGQEFLQYALIIIALAVVLILVTLLGLTAIYRLIKRVVVSSRSKKEWNRKQKEEIAAVAAGSPPQK